MRIYLSVLCVLYGEVAAFAQTRKPVGEEWTDVKPLFALVEQVAAGRPAPADVTLAWQCHFLNADAGVVFAPFTLAIERGAFEAFPLGMYVRVVKRGAPAPAPGPRDALAQYPFEDAAIVDKPTGRISRAFTAPPGEYDVYVALTERVVASASKPKTVVVKQAVTVPAFPSNLTTSSVIVAEKVEANPSARRPTFEEQLDDPYALWGTRVTPAVSNKFGRKDKLSVIFLVYNAAATADDKPDVEVRYSIYQKTGSTEAFVAATKPEVFNAATLAPQFSAAAGDLIVAGQEVPLKDFPDREYRLEIRVLDKIAGTSIVRDVNFLVADP